MKNEINVICVIFIFIATLMLVKAVIEIFQKKRSYQRGVADKVRAVIFAILYTVFGGVAVFWVQEIWPEIYQEYQTGMLLGMAGFCIFVFYYFITDWFANGKLRIVLISFIGIAGALGYAVIMLVLDMAVKGKSNYAYFAFFVLAMATYVYAQKITRANMIAFANQQVVKYRNQLFSIVLNTRQERYEKLDIGRIYTCMNNDMEILGNNVRDIITVLTNTLTIAACFGYLAVLDFKCFLLSLGIFIAAVTLQMVYVGQQEKIFEKLMRLQHNVYNFLDAAVKGHKELAVSKRKKTEFMHDVAEMNEMYTGTRIYAENKKTNMFILGQSLLYVVIGCVIFVFPIIFQNADPAVLQSYALVFLFIISPISYLVDLAPRVMETKVSYKRIVDLMNELEGNVEDVEECHTGIESIESIELKDVCYAYEPEKSEENGFQIGPISCTILPHKINFIIGSNGSGKSTLIKVLTGLYEKSSGEILINGEKSTAQQRCEYFSSVYSDYHLFKKLYGISTEGKDQIIKQRLEQLRISDKLEIKDRELSTVDLSSGQRKRIALLLCCLENKNVYVFDEWAADQDVVFREFFYRELLLQMKAEGKTVIAITHDDRYFDVADQLLYMDMGNVSRGTKTWKK